jgi:hypothetical protein
MQKPGFLNNTCAKSDTLKGAATQTLARKTRAKILAGCSGSQSLYSDTLKGIGFLTLATIL